MNYIVDFSSNEPAYLQLYKQLRADIQSGAYGFGVKLPSKRIISAETGASIITVEHALSLLSDEGYVESRERSGYFVIFRPGDFLSASASGFNDYAAPHKTELLPVPPHTPPTSPDSFPFSIISRTMRKVILDYGESILTRSPNHGCPELRNEIAAYLARSRGINVHPGRIIIGSGAEYMYMLIAQLFGRSHIFAIEDPSYNKIRNVYESFGVKIDMLPLESDGISSESLAKTTADILHVTPFNSFPSGISIDISKKHEYLSWANERGGYIIEDNYDSELTISRKPEDSLFSLSKGKNVLYINTFSKTIAASIRIGYMVIPDSLASLFDEKLGFYACTVPLFDQYVLAELFKSGDFERHINRVRRNRRKAISNMV